jgi:hypothetical protein
MTNKKPKEDSMRITAGELELAMFQLYKSGIWYGRDTVEDRLKLRESAVWDSYQQELLKLGFKTKL